MREKGRMAKMIMLKRVRKIEMVKSVLMKRRRNKNKRLKGD